MRPYPFSANRRRHHLPRKKEVADTATRSVLLLNLPFSKTRQRHSPHSRRGTKAYSIGSLNKSKGHISNPHNPDRRTGRRVETLVGRDPRKSMDGEIATEGTTIQTTTRRAIVAKIVGDNALRMKSGVEAYRTADVSTVEIGEAP